MRKLILIMALVMPAILTFGQTKEDQHSLFFRIGGGYAQRLAQLPAQLDADGKDHYSNLRSGANLNLQLGFMIAPNTAIAAVYSRFGSKASDVIQKEQRNSKDALTFAGITIQKFIPVSDKKDVTFNFKIGPGGLFYRSESTVTSVANVTRFEDVNDQALGLLTGAGVDFHLSKTLRFELNVDKTWGRLNVNKVITNLEFIAVGAGFRFQF